MKKKTMEFFEAHKKIVIKTPACASSSDVFVCTTPEQVTKAMTKILHHPSPWKQAPTFAVLEKFIEGQEYAINLFVTPKETYVTDMWRYQRKVTCDGNVLYDSIYNEDCTAPHHVELCNYGRGIAKAIGVLYGPVHLEVMQTHDGPVMVEVGARISGGRKCVLAAKMVPGWDPHSALIDVFSGAPVSIPKSFQPQKHAAHLFINSETNGFLRKISGEDELKLLLSYEYHLIRCAVGKQVVPTTDIVTCLGFVWFLHDDMAQIMIDLEKARLLLKFEFENEPF